MVRWWQRLDSRVPGEKSYPIFGRAFKTLSMVSDVSWHGIEKRSFRDRSAAQLSGLADFKMFYSQGLTSAPRDKLSVLDWPGKSPYIVQAVACLDCCYIMWFSEIEFKVP